jgi:galactokinase
MKLNEFTSWLNSKPTSDLLKDLYPSVSDAQNRISQSIELFSTHFPNHDEIEIFSSSGRVELIGNHTDHQGGLVLGCAVHLDTCAIVSHNHSNIIQCISHGYEPISIRCDDIEYKSDERHSTQAIVRGCMALFSEQHTLSGLDIYVHSLIPSGAGLSSSAAFECLLLEIFNYTFAKNNPLSSMDVAKLAQKVENFYFGKPSGLLDQLCVTYGGMNLLDFKAITPKITPIDVRDSLKDYDLCVVKVLQSHDDLTFAYKSIVDECDLISRHYSKNRLIDIDESMFYHDFNKLSTLVSSRSILRAHHFFSENQRVLLSKQAIMNNHPLELLNQINTSGHSSFEYLDNVKHPISEKHELALAIALAQNYLKDVGAVRVHGGGFAGSILCLSPKSQTQNLRTIMEQQFGSDCFFLCKVRKQGVYCITT